MELGIITSIWGISGIPLAESVRRAAAHGFAYVDLFGKGHGDPRFLSVAERREVGALARDLGLSVSALVSLFPANSASPDPQLQRRNWEYLMRCMDWAEELGTRKLTYICGERQAELRPAEAWKHSVAFAQRCAAEAERRRLFLTLEFEPFCAAVVPDLERSREFIEAVGSPAFGFNLDTGHANVVRAAPDEVVPLAPYTVHLHLSDNRGLFDSHDELGTGTTPNAAYLAVLQAAGVDARSQALGLGPTVATIEINLAMVPPAVRPDPDEVVGRALQHIRDTMPELARSLKPPTVAA